MTKDMKKMLKPFITAGWAIDSQKKHYKWKHPMFAGSITTSCTPSDRNAVKMMVKDFTKASKAAGIEF